MGGFPNNQSNPAGAIPVNVVAGGGGGGLANNTPATGGNAVLINNDSVSGPVVSNLYGGSYVFSVQGTFSGATVSLMVLGPDGTTYETLVSKTAPDTIGGTGVGLPQGATVQAVITGGPPSAIFATLARLP